MPPSPALTPRARDGPAPGRQQCQQTTPPREDLFGQLVGLARSAHVNVDLEDPADYWYRLGQRNAYAHAAGMCLAPAADPRHFTVADRITASLSDGVTDLDALTRAARAALPGHQAPTRDSAGLEWIGPKAFQARYGELPGIDHDYGMRWGESQDTRISLRHPTGATAGLLYAYNATWDEYAVLHPFIDADVVESAFAQALTADPRMPAEQFAMLVHRHDQTRQIDAAPRPVLGVQP